MPWNGEGGGDGKFSWEALNYAPLMVGAVFLFAAIFWQVKAKHYFTGQTKNIEIDQALAAGADPDKPAPPAP